MSTVAQSVCPLCGEEHDPSPLLVAADAYVIKVLEHAGNRIVRAERSRWSQLTVPLCRAHMLWPMASDAEVAPLLKGAWTALAELALPWECYGRTPVQVAGLLDVYVTDLLLTGSQHSVEELAYRLGIS